LSEIRILRAPRKSISGTQWRADNDRGQNQDNPFTWTVSHEMNHRESPHLPAGLRRALRCLSLLLVPALTLDEGHAGTRLRSAIRPHDSVPYLPVLGSPSLRFEEALPPPDLVARPAAAAPPVPALSPTESSVAQANADAARSTAVPSGEQPVAAATKPVVAEPAPAPAVKTPAPIIPDAMHPVVHAEDFLPYFQIPGSAKQSGDVIMVVPGAPSAPTPAPIPQSSATYIQR
jgi:hypothetical protein